MTTPDEIEMRYGVRAEWSGFTATAGGPAGFNTDHWVGSETLAPIPGTTGRGDGASPYRYNSEQLLAASVATSHMLAFLGLASEAGLSVTAYLDRARAEVATRKGRTRIQRIVLQPRITLGAGADLDIALALVKNAVALSSIGSALSVEVDIEPSFETEEDLLEVA